jgi:hypothetical protein
MAAQRKLNTIIFVTSRCNATCETCFYWDELNRQGDLSWEEIVKLSENTPPFTDLWFSGGTDTSKGSAGDRRPFREEQRRDLYQPADERLKPYRIYEVADQCLRKNPGLELHVNVSIDGLREYHDFMRGVRRFDKALERAAAAAIETALRTPADRQHQYGYESRQPR